MKIFLFCLMLCTASYAQEIAPRPVSYTELLDYVQQAPDQGQTGTCLFVGSTGAMELIANKMEGIKNPQPGGKYDLTESLVINLGYAGYSMFEDPVHRLSEQGGIHISHWPYNAWYSNGQINKGVWSWNEAMRSAPRVKLPKIETIKLFQIGGRFSTNVLEQKHINQIKDALWKYKSPVLVNYNDEDIWHVILIVGYDDRLPGECYDNPEKVCNKDVGSFYIRDSFGINIEVRDYDWFRVKGNAAVVVKPVTASAL